MLPQKYRPQSFDSVIGQDHVLKALKSSILSGNIGSAFLFSGLRGSGKTTLARVLSKTINCKNNKQTPLLPCEKCLSCESFNQKKNLDVLEVDAASNTGVDSIREIIDSCVYRPVDSRFKIFIIDEVHMLSKSAFNALLKTLEEPPVHVKFIFATTEIKKIPETILSRCLKLSLYPIESSVMIDYLKEILKKENAFSEDDALGAIVRAAEGSVRDALSLLEHALLLSKKNITFETVKEMLGLTAKADLFDIVHAIFESNLDNALEKVIAVTDRGENPIAFLESFLDLIYWLCAFQKYPALEKNITWPMEDRMNAKELAQKIPLSVLIKIWNSLIVGLDELKKTPNLVQGLHMLFMKQILISKSPDLEELFNKIKRKDGEASQPQNFL